jgi:hypothetical protein
MLIRKIYRKFINPDNINGNEAFPKKEGYYRLGGNKNSKKRNKTKKQRNK